jgi:hypothetical protein
MIKKYYKNKGYTLLFAVIVSAVVLSVGISILTISRKEFLLSSSARESTYAFYAADSGLECAAFHDMPENGDKFTNNNLAGVKCAGMTVTSVVNASGNKIFDFKLLNLNNPDDITDGPCVRVSVLKQNVTDPATGITVKKTTIDSWGYNKGWNSGVNTCGVGGTQGGLSSPDRVERSLKYIYYK